MKATKKLMSLVLALMMVLSLMAVPAMAYGHDDGVSPQGLVRPGTEETCSICGAKMDRVYYPDKQNYYLVCPNNH